MAVTARSKGVSFHPVARRQTRPAGEHALPTVDGAVRFRGQKVWTSFSGGPPGDLASAAG